jgi:hypothetical protein
MLIIKYIKNTNCFLSKKCPALNETHPVAVIETINILETNVVSFNSSIKPGSTLNSTIEYIEEYRILNPNK